MTRDGDDGGPIRIGDAAPDFALAAVNRDGEVGLGDYVGRRSLLLGLFRGLHCPFCRRQVAQMDGYADALDGLGVDLLAVINTELSRARVYYGRTRMTMPLAVDPHWDTHRRYGLARPKVTLGKSDWPRKVNPFEVLALRLNPTGELARPVSPLRANEAVNRIDGFKPTLVDRKMQIAHGNTGAGYTLIDRQGRVRWQWLEGETGLKDIAKFPSKEVIVAEVGRALADG